MNIEIEQKELLRLASTAMRGCALSDKSVPIFRQVKVSAKMSNVLAATGCDSSTYVTATGLPEHISVLEGGELCLPAKELASYAGELSPGKVSLKVDGNKCIIGQGRSKANLPITDARDFPVIPEMEETEAVDFEVADLKSALSCTLPFCESALGTQFSGLTLRSQGHLIELMGTDRHRIASSFIVPKTGTEGQINDGLDWNLMLPVTSLKSLLALLPDVGRVEVSAGRFMRFAWPGAELICPLMTSEVKPPSKIWACGEAVQMEVRRDDMMSALRRLEIATQGNITPATWQIVEGQDEIGELLIKVPSQTGTGIEEEIEVCASAPFPEVFSLNPTYLLQALNVFKCEMVTLYLRGPIVPVVITETGCDPEALPVQRHLVLPVNLK